MGNVALHDLLQPQVMLDVVSRMRTPNNRMAKWFGFLTNRFDEGSGELRGPNTTRTPVRSGVYNIFDNTRTVASARAPGTGPATISPNPYGQVTYQCIRWHEKTRFLAEDLGNLAKVFGPNTMIDEGGQSYIAQQTKFLLQRFNNAVELATWAMFRGTLYLSNVGDNWIPLLTAPSAPTPYITINYRIPTGNTLKLNMLGAGDIIATSWDTITTPILSHLAAIDAAMTQLTGDSLQHVWINSKTWMNVIKNTQVINAAGSANTPFATFDRIKEKGYDGEEVSEYTAVLRGMPFITFHINNAVLVADGGTDPSYAAGTGALTMAIPDNYALFMPDPKPDWIDWLECPEYVSEQPGQPMVQHYGMHFWSEYITQPTCIELLGLLNGIPRVRRPKNLAYATVVY